MICSQMLDSSGRRADVAFLPQETKKNRLSSQSTPSLKRLQAQPDQQIGKAQAVATAANSHQQIIDTIGSQAAQADENARIERELAKMKEDRLKAIQALPSSVWH